MEKTNAEMDTIENPNSPMAKPDLIARRAPRDAPPDIPRVKGEASGFLNRACSAAPAIASVPPAIVAIKTLVILILKKIVWVNSFISEKASNGLISYLPLKIAINEVITQRINKPDIDTINFILELIADIYVGIVSDWEKQILSHFLF